MTWHIVTGEYPPQRGGVSVYTRQVARGLADAGEAVVVWAPAAAGDAADRGVDVRRLSGGFGRRSLRRLGAELDRERAPHRLLVQYGPHAFGWKGANVPLCRWIAQRRTPVWVMFHEVGFPFDVSQSPLRNALALVNRRMARLVAGAAERVFVSIPGWRPMIDTFVPPTVDIEWLPVPSGVRVAADASASAAIRARYAGERPLVGHFGTHGDAIRAQIAAAAPRLLGRTDANLLLIGPRGDVARAEILARDATLAPRVHATGALPEDAVSAHLSACDAMLQPYPDGISSRRTSAMASLAHGLPIVTTAGWLTEPLWRDTEAVALVPVDETDALVGAAAELLASSDARGELGRRGRALYDAHFDLRHTIATLCGPRVAPQARVSA